MLIELAQNWKHYHLLKRDRSGYDTSRCQACIHLHEIEMWAREKAKEWRQFSDLALEREDFPEALRNGISEGVEACLTDLGVKEEE